MTTIYVPGKGRFDVDVLRADKAAREYDERLFFDRHSETGDWCVFIRMPHGQPAYPVLGFGTTVPEPFQLQKRLYETDGLRFGQEMMDRLLRDMQREKASTEKAQLEMDAELAEVYESFYHGQGNMVKYHRSHSKAHKSKRTGGK